MAVFQNLMKGAIKRRPSRNQSRFQQNWPLPGPAEKVVITYNYNITPSTFFHKLQCNIAFHRINIVMIASRPVVWSDVVDTANVQQMVLPNMRQLCVSGERRRGWSRPDSSGGGIVEETYPFLKGTTATRTAIAVATVGNYHAMARRAPVPESTGLPTRVVSKNVGRLLGPQAWRVAAPRMLCGVDIRWRLGKDPYARKASTASATGGNLSRSTPPSTRPSNVAKETITVIR